MPWFMRAPLGSCPCYLTWFLPMLPDLVSKGVLHGLVHVRIFVFKDVLPNVVSKGVLPDLVHALMVQLHVQGCATWLGVQGCAI